MAADAIGSVTADADVTETEMAVAVTEDVKETVTVIVTGDATATVTEDVTETATVIVTEDAIETVTETATGEGILTAELHRPHGLEAIMPMEIPVAAKTNNKKGRVK